MPLEVATLAFLACLAAQQTPPPGPAGQEKAPESAPLPSPDKAGMSFYPLPAFSGDKDAGLSAGVLGGLVFTDQDGVQNALLSLSVNYQHLVKWNGEVEWRISPDLW